MGTTFDPRDMPFARSVPYRERQETRVPGGGMTGANQAVDAAQALSGGEATTLKAENILLEEFNAAGAAAYQAREESASLVNLFLLGAGALGTAFGVLVSTTTRSNKLSVTLIEVTILAVASLFCFAIFARFLDLGREYREGLVAMNVIKEFYIGRLSAQFPQLEAAFSRRLAHVPPRRVLGSGAAVMTATVAVLGAFALAGTVGQARQFVAIASDTSAPYLTELQVAGLALPYAWEVLAGLLGLALQFAYYRLAGSARRP